MVTPRELEEKKAEQAMKPKRDPLEQDARAELRKDPKYREMEKEIRKLTRQNENLSELLSHKEIPDKKKVERINNGGPVETGMGNVGGAASAKIIQYATKKYLAGEWNELDIERYLFHEAGWLEKAQLRTRQIVKYFSKNQAHGNTGEE
jgi:predicted RNase H-like nuclease (RuvC/YqgF family)